MEVRVFLHHHNQHLECGKGYRVIGFRVIGFKVIGFRVIGFRVIGFRVIGFLYSHLPPL